MENELRPRLCFLIKGKRGYGFHLHGEKKNGGQFIRTVEPDSPADQAGLRPGDRLVEVNGENVEKETHHQVVKRICEAPHRTRLLVVDRKTDEYLRSQGLACTEDQAIEMGNLSPRPSPKPTPSASPIPRENSPLSLKSNLRYFFHFPAVDSPTTKDTRKRASIASSSTTDTELQVEPSPEPRVELTPRLCHLVKAENGYCFNLQNDKKKGGQFVRSVDPDSPAEMAGVRAGDRIVELVSSMKCTVNDVELEMADAGQDFMQSSFLSNHRLLSVNGVNIRGLRHSEVVALIRSRGDEVSLLVVDQETDELFRRLGIIPTIAHIKEVYVDDRRAESTPPTPSPTTELPATDAPVISVTLTDSDITNSSPKSRANGSSASHSSRSSTTQSEISSSDMSFQVPEDNDSRISDPFVESGLRLSPTAAEARQKVLATRNKKRAPPMDWSRRQELFSNF